MIMFVGFGWVRFWGDLIARIYAAQSGKKVQLRAWVKTLRFARVWILLVLNWGSLMVLLVEHTSYPSKALFITYLVLREFTWFVLLFPAFPKLSTLHVNGYIPLYYTSLISKMRKGGWFYDFTMSVVLAGLAQALGELGCLRLPKSK